MNNMKRLFTLFAVVFVAMCLFTLFAGCSNDLTDYLNKSLFYEGWKIGSWSEPKPVVDGETHEEGDAKRNGFPMNMVMGSNGKIHLVGFRVFSFEWVYAVRNPGEDRFVQKPFTVLPDTGSVRPDDIGLMPGMDLMSDDVPMIAYGADGILYFQICNAVDGWYSPEELCDVSTAFGASNVTNVFVVLSPSDYSIHLFFLAGEKGYHTVRDNRGTISPDPPEEVISDAGALSIVRLKGGDTALLYTNSVKDTLYYREFGENTPVELYSLSGEDSIVIGGITGQQDSNGTIHILFGTYNSSAPFETEDCSVYYLRRRDGTWEQKESIEGNESSGPSPMFPPAMDVVEDSNGNTRLHLAFTRIKDPLGFYIHYGYYDEIEGWHITEESVDTVYTNSFWTFPLIEVDPEGEAHIVYSWTQSELDRTMMHVRGEPSE